VPLTGVINYVFCIYICCFIANFCHTTRLVVNSRIVTEPTLLYFHFYLCGRWNLITNWHPSSPLGSRSVTIWPFRVTRRYRSLDHLIPSSHILQVLYWHQLRISNRRRGDGPQISSGHDLHLSRSRKVIIHVTIRIRMDHSYWWSIGKKSLSPSVFKIFGLKYIEARPWPFRVR